MEHKIFEDDNKNVSNKNKTDLYFYKNIKFKAYTIYILNIVMFTKTFSPLGMGR